MPAASAMAVDKTILLRMTSPPRDDCEPQIVCATVNEVAWRSLRVLHRNGHATLLKATHPHFRFLEFLG
ncbi:hypothetical protein AGR3A_Lc140063 [Agrobacterium tomkonis CFBP 6623]|uniref:Uncharacterized protein n=1 Tax=Agrobacterium tomkonis CFBP 6623 TaxID=1183432 RepID=A0A1S7RKW7_9HYPH|nr:hypothetical protein AGR3A_Lc140063 [Agrobacterium tomkonis CFBP 6623]